MLNQSFFDLCITYFTFLCMDMVLFFVYLIIHLVLQCPVYFSNKE